MKYYNYHFAKYITFIFLIYNITRLWEIWNGHNILIKLVYADKIKKNAKSIFVENLKNTANILRNKEHITNNAIQKLL